MKRKKEDPEERCVRLAEYLLEERGTVRGAAARFGISKSTVHKDVTERLSRVRPALSLEVRQLLLENKAVRHLRGGEATRRKYRGLDRNAEKVYNYKDKTEK